jgi:hypothetical protein
MRITGYLLAGLLVAWTFDRSAHGQSVIGDMPACADCSVRVEVVTRLSSESAAPIPSVLPSAAAVDAKGDYLISFYATSLPLRFGRDGTFIGELGRYGQGPGEFTNPFFVSRLPGDSILVLDRVNNRATIYDADYTPTRTVRIPLAHAHSAGAAGWPHVGLNAIEPSAESIGLSLHLLDLSTEEASTVWVSGPEEPNVTPRNMHMLEIAAILPGTNGSVWAIEKHRYRITQWGPDGRLLRTLERRPTWFSDPSSGDYGRRDAPPPPRVVGAHLSDANQLWVYLWVAADTWRDAWTDVPRPGVFSEVPSYNLPNFDKLFRTIIEVIDLSNGTLVSHAWSGHRIVRPLNHQGLVLTQRLGEFDTPTLAVLRLSLSRP